MKKLILLMLIVASKSLIAQNTVRFSPELNVGDRIEIVNKKILNESEKLGIQMLGKIENVPDTATTTITLSVLESNKDFFIFDSKTFTDEITKTISNNSNFSEFEAISPKIRLNKNNSQLSLEDSVNLMNTYEKVFNAKIDESLKIIDSINIQIEKRKEIAKGKKKKNNEEDDSGSFLEQMTLMGAISGVGALIGLNDPELIRLVTLGELEPVFSLTNCELNNNSITKIPSIGNSSNFGVYSYLQVSPVNSNKISFETLTLFDTTLVDKSKVKTQFKKYLTKIYSIIDRVESEKNKPRKNIDDEVNEKLSNIFNEDPNLLVKKMNIEFNTETKLPKRIIIDKKQMIENQGTEEEKALMKMDTSVTNIIDVKVIRK